MSKIPMLHYRARLTNQENLPLLVGGLIFTYLILRAIVVPITTDEFLTLRYFVEHDWLTVLSSFHPDITHASNNHVLNSIFFKLSISIFGEHDWAIRLHVLAAFIVCYYFVWKLFRLLEIPPIRLTAYLMLVFLNPYLLDFFAIARGYALSMAGWSAATYYFILYQKTASLLNLRNVLIWLFVTVYANFSALYFALLLGIGIVYLLYKNRKEPFISQHLLALFCGAVLMAAIIAVPLYRTIIGNSAHGGTTSFFTDTIVSYVVRSIHYSPYIRKTGVFVLGWRFREVYGGLLITAWLVVIYSSNKLPRLKIMDIAQQNLLFQCIGVVLICIVLFQTLKVPYPLSRTTLLFSLPFVVSFLLALETIIRLRKWFKYILFLLVLAAVWHFMACCNLENTIEWQSEGDAKRVLKYLKENRNENKLVTIGVENWRYPSMAFYERSTYKEVVDVEWSAFDKEVDFDFVYVPVEMQQGLEPQYALEKKFKHGVLLRRIRF